jgi:23S rRNA (pseudouridine1915-N3)-methyltransferase
VDDRKADGMSAEAELLRRAVPEGAVLVVLDERGRMETSPDFAQRLAAWRDQGRGDLALVIGGADGIDPGLRAQADFALSFGKMVWPHMLARVMLSEQLYRAASILAGAPYHRV